MTVSSAATTHPTNNNLNVYSGGILDSVNTTRYYIIEKINHTDTFVSSTILDQSSYNMTTSSSNYSNRTTLETEDPDAADLIDNEIVQIIFCILYTTVFVLGVFGNVLVCYVVLRNKAMQTVTNIFITNLALSDILLCVLAVPFTPLYSFLRGWIFGKALCHLVPYAQGCSIYISTLTLTSIAIDRYFVIIYPFHPRMKLSTCIAIIVSIWVISLLFTLPYGLYVKVFSLPDEDGSGIMTTYCEEDWPSEKYRKVFSSVTTILQFVLPFFFISICYTWVSLKLSARAKAKPGSKNSKKEEADRDRKKRTNRMLISMVAVFGISWLPINFVNVFNDFYADSADWTFYKLLFFIAHSIAMSSTCYNPFLYAWLNENFRKEFKHVLPCFDPSNNNIINITRSCRADRNINAHQQQNQQQPQQTQQHRQGLQHDNDIENENILPAITHKREIQPREATFGSINGSSKNALSIPNRIDILLNDDPMRVSSGRHSIVMEVSGDTTKLSETPFMSSDNTGTSNLDTNSMDNEKPSSV